jgi:hypothetical protein
MTTHLKQHPGNSLAANLKEQQTDKIHAVICNAAAALGRLFQKKKNQDRWVEICTYAA